MKTFYLLIVMMCLSSVVVFGANDPNAIDNVKMFSYGDGYTVALKNDGSVWGMGRNDKGQLHYDIKGDIKSWYRLPIYIRVAPKKVEWINIVSVSAGYMQSVGLDYDGNVWCWGYRYSTYNGRTILDRFAPSKVVGLSKIVKVVFNTSGYTAIDNKGNIWDVDNNKKITKIVLTKVTQIAKCETMTLVMANNKLYSWTNLCKTPVERVVKDITEIQGSDEYCLMTDKNFNVFIISEREIKTLKKEKSNGKV